MHTERYYGALLCSMIEYNRMDKQQTTKEVSDDLISMGIKMTMGITLPVFLFVLGLFMMPFGLILWVIAIIIFTKVFAPK